jgi:hypothetical protein
MSNEEYQELIKVFPNAMFRSQGLGKGLKLIYEDCSVTGMKIRKLRESDGLTLKQFSEEIAWNIDNLQDWEKGKWGPCESALEDISTYFGVSKSYFYSSNLEEFEQLSLFY